MSAGPVKYDPGLHGTSPASRLIRALINRIAPLRLLVKSSFVQSLVYTVRVGRAVESPWPFVAAQVRGADLIPVTVPDSGARVFLRGRSGDLVMYHQIIGRDSYGLPAPVAAGLDLPGRAIRVADLGANVGLFTVALLGHRPKASVLAFEADPANAAVFERTIEANGWQDRVELNWAAAMNRAGRVELSGGELFRSQVDPLPTDSESGVPAVDVLPLLADADLIKMDIEGSEWQIIEDPRFRHLEAQVIALEWHRRHCPSDRPREAAESALEAAGYQVAHRFFDDDCGTLWAWKPGFGN